MSIRVEHYGDYCKIARLFVDDFARLQHGLTETFADVEPEAVVTISLPQEISPDDYAEIGDWLAGHIARGWYRRHNDRTWVFRRLSDAILFKLRFA